MSDERAPVAPALDLRFAQPADLPQIIQAAYEDPEPPMVRFFGSRELTRSVGSVLISYGLEISLQHATVAEANGGVVAVMESGTVHDRVSAMRALRAVPALLRVLGPRMITVLWRLRHRASVQFDAVPGAYPVGALYTAPSHRNRGIGRALLVHAERLASDGGLRSLSIETGIDNPARRLYERHGFVLQDEKRNEGYEQATGSPGRVLMLKALE